MLYLGCHLSASGGYAAMCRTARSIGANTFQFFTRNPRGGAAKAIDPADAQTLVHAQETGELGQVVAHAPYTVNPCSAEEKTREFAVQTLADDLRRLRRGTTTISIRAAMSDRAWRPGSHGSPPRSTR